MTRVLICLLALRTGLAGQEEVVGGAVLDSFEVKP